MSNIENLFKHKFPFNFGKCGTRMEVPTTNTLYYGIDTIKNGNSIGIYSIDVCLTNSNHFYHIYSL